jgi:hypothetical protein
MITHLSCQVSHRYRQQVSITFAAICMADAAHYGRTMTGKEENDTFKKVFVTNVTVQKELQQCMEGRWGYQTSQKGKSVPLEELRMGRGQAHMWAP